MNRRSFIGVLFGIPLFASAALLAKWWLKPVTGRFGRTIMIADEVALLPLIHGRSTVLSVLNGRVAVVYDSGVFKAFSLVCTHSGCPLQPSKNTFICHCHGGVFSFTGRVLDGPPREPLREIPAHFVRGRLFLTIPADKS